MNMVRVRRKFLDRNDNLIKSLYPGTVAIHGPYLAPDNRYRVFLYYGHDCKPRGTTKQYCKLKMEIKLERRIDEPETVDHDNGNTKDDRYENLIIRDRSVHAKLDVKRLKKVRHECPWCLFKFLAYPRRARPQEKAGPFCSKQCAGKYAKHIQMGGRRIKPTKVKKKYYRLKEIY